MEEVVLCLTSRKFETPNYWTRLSVSGVSYSDTWLNVGLMIVKTMNDNYAVFTLSNYAWYLQSTSNCRLLMIMQLNSLRLNILNILGLLTSHVCSVIKFTICIIVQSHHLNSLLLSCKCICSYIVF